MQLTPSISMSLRSKLRTLPTVPQRLLVKARAAWPDLAVLRTRIDTWELPARRLWARAAVALRRAPVRRLLTLLSAYLLLLFLTEGLTIATANSFPAVGLACYGLLALVLLGHVILCWNGSWRALPLLFACATGLRLLQVSGEHAGHGGPWPALALAIATLAALGAAAHTLGLARLSPAVRTAVVAGFLAAVLLQALCYGLATAFPGIQGVERAGLAAAGRAAAAHAPGAGGVLAVGQPGWLAPFPKDRVEAVAAQGLCWALGLSSSWPRGPAGTERLPPRPGAIAREAGVGGAASAVGGESSLWPYNPLSAALSTSARPRRDAVLSPRPALAPDVVEPEPTPKEAPRALAPACPTPGYENLYPRGVCTWYAKERRPDLPSFSGDYGWAMNWPLAARLCGFRVDAEPAVGAVIVFPPGANGADVGGHVGYVEEVGTDYLLISECNVSPGYPCYEEPMYWVGGYFCANRRIDFTWLDAGVRFIHGRE